MGGCQCSLLNTAMNPSISPIRFRACSCPIRNLIVSHSLQMKVGWRIHISTIGYQGSHRRKWIHLVPMPEHWPDDGCEEKDSVSDSPRINHGQGGSSGWYTWYTFSRGSHHMYPVTQESCDLWDIWSEWWGDTDLPTYLLVTFQTLLTILTIENLNFTVFVRLQHLGNMQLSNCSSCFCQV